MRVRIAPSLDLFPVPARSRFATRVVGSYGTNIAMAVLSLANVLVISRALGPTGRGEVAFLITVGYLTAQFASLGVQQANANIGGSEPEAQPSLATNSLGISLGLGIVAIGVLAVLIGAFPAVGAHSGSLARWIAFASIPAVIFADYLATLMQSDYRFAPVNVAAIVAPLAIIAANGALALAGLLTPTRAVAAWAGGQLIRTLALAGYMGLRGRGFGRPEPALARRMLGFGLRTHATRVMSFGNYRLDQWLVGSIAGARELGLYSVAVAWSEGLFFLPNALAAVQRPDLVRASPGEAYVRARRAHLVGQAVTLLLALVMIAFAGPLCTVVFGPAFHGSVAELRILALGGFGIAALKQLGDALTAQRKPLLESIAMAAAFVLTLALDIVLIPLEGGVGAAIASVTAYSAGGLAVWFIFERTLRAPTAPTASREAAS